MIAVRRLLALARDADATDLHAQLAPLAPPGAIDLLRAYMFDPLARPLPADLTGPLFVPVLGGVAPIDDRIAAILAAPSIDVPTFGVLPVSLLRYRWSPRADDLVALAVAHQPLPIQPTALSQLVVDLGPDCDVLALSSVQCGRVLAWSPHLLEWPLAETVVGELLSLLEPSRPEPLLALVARALAPLAPRKSPLQDRIHARALASLDHGPALARAGAYILGFEDDPAGAMVDTFIDGLVAAANVPRIADLVATGLAEGDEIAALELAARIPLDPLAEILRAVLEDPELGVLAARACALLEGAPEIVPVAPPVEPDPTASEIATWLDGRHDDGVAPLMSAGRVLPADHAAWDQIRSMLDEPALRDAAWCALRDRARRDA